MGCCYSLPSTNHEADGSSEPTIDGGGDPPLTKFSFSDIKTATNNFSPENIISEKVFNVVYKGCLQNDGFIAVKRFKYMAWPNPNQFAEEAQRVGKLNHKRLVKLIGYCIEEDERLLIAEFMPNDTLAKRLFLRKHRQIMEWPMRLQVAYCVAEALDYCSTAGFASYNSLSAYKVLFDEDGDACLSCFGLIKENKDVQGTGSVNPESVTFRFGTVLVNLLSGKQIPPSHAPEMIHGKNVIKLMDPYLKGKFSIDEATVVVKLASQCLQDEKLECPNTKELVATLEALQTRTDVPSNEMIEMKKQHEEISLTQLSPLGEACSRLDLAAIHKILAMTKNEDENEFSFEEWIQEVKDLQEVRKLGDQAFLDQDFETAIHCYSKFVESRGKVYPSVYARRSLCYLFCNDPERALLDGMNAQGVFPDWPTAFYLQSVALAKLNMNTDSADTLKEATILEATKLQQ